MASNSAWGLGIRPARFDKFGKRGLLSERRITPRLNSCSPPSGVSQTNWDAQLPAQFRQSACPRRSSCQPLSETKVPPPFKSELAFRGGGSLHFDVTQPWILRGFNLKLASLDCKMLHSMFDWPEQIQTSPTRRLQGLYRRPSMRRTRGFVEADSAGKSTRQCPWISARSWRAGDPQAAR